MSQRHLLRSFPIVMDHRSSNTPDHTWLQRHTRVSSTIVYLVGMAMIAFMVSAPRIATILIGS